MKLAVIGDMHMQFDEEDVRFFNASDYDAILMVGDLASKNPDSMFRLLPLLNQLTKPSYFIPGNHDTTGVRQLLGELMHNETLINFGAASQETRMAKLKAELKAPVLCGYSSHDLGDLRLICARPFSMGDAHAAKTDTPLDLPVNFRPFMEKQYHIKTLGDSAERIKSLIDAVNPPYIIMAHHGPFGLGAKATDMFGADFLPEETDFGDHDLSTAIAYAIEIKKPPLAVIAGHMHYPTKHGKKPKQWHLRKDDILYVNAARWPRIFKHGENLLHHHVVLNLKSDGSREAAACFVAGAAMLKTDSETANLPH